MGWSFLRTSASSCDLTREERAIAFPIPVASVLTGASVGQLYNWRRTDLLRPEESDARPLLYSFRDLLALRAVVSLREETSLQRIRKAFRTMETLDFTDHPSRYDLVRVEDTIMLRDTEDTAIDLVRDPGQRIANLGDLLQPFQTSTGETVVDFLQPREHLQVRQRRLDGWPTIKGTRIKFDTIANLMRDGSVAPKDVKSFYPAVSAAAARDALDFMQSLPTNHEESAAA